MCHPWNWNRRMDHKESGSLCDQYYCLRINGVVPQSWLGMYHIWFLWSFFNLKLPYFQPSFYQLTEFCSTCPNTNWDSHPHNQTRCPLQHHNTDRDPKSTSATEHSTIHSSYYIHSRNGSALKMMMIIMMITIIIIPFYYYY